MSGEEKEMMIEGTQKRLLLENFLGLVALEENLTFCHVRTYVGLSRYLHVAYRTGQKSVMNSYVF